MYTMLRPSITRGLRHSLLPLYLSHTSSLRLPPVTSIQAAIHLPRPHHPHFPNQQSRGIFNSYRKRVRHERETGNWASLRIPVVVAILTTTAGLLLIVYGYTKYQEWSARALHNYPPVVAKQLRRAIYYSSNPGSSSYSPKDAIRHFIMALEKAREEDLHPLSREVTGIKIEIARVCEECGRKDKAVEVLSEVWGALRKGLEIWDARMKEGRENTSMKIPNLRQERDSATKEAPPNLQQKTFELELERTGLVRRVIEVGVKLGGLLLENWITEESQASKAGETKRKQDGERVLEIAIKTIIEEQRRRLDRINTQKELPNVTENRREDGWLTSIELAAAFEILATHYLATSRPQLATPLLVYAIRTLYPEEVVGFGKGRLLSINDPTQICHAATLMNIMSAALSELPPNTSSHLSASATHITQLTPVEAAEYWANLVLRLMTLQHVDPGMKPGSLVEMLKSEECVQAKIVARINLSEMLLQRGDREGAIKGFEEARREAREGNWKEGLERAEQGIRNAGRKALGRRDVENSK